MTTLRQAAQQALEALEMFENCDAFIPSLRKLSQDDAEQEEERRAVVYAQVGKAIPALRAALEQPEQEPVAWGMDALKDAFFEGFYSVKTYDDTRLNSPEEEWENFTPPRETALEQSEQIITPSELAAALGWPGGVSDPVLDKVELLRMVALKEKNNG